MIVVADTSVLLNLCRVGEVELLRSLFQDVVIPPEVASAFGRRARQAARFTASHDVNSTLVPCPSGSGVG